MQSSWHREVVEECRLAFLEEIEARGIERAHIDLFEVPGSFEIPLHAQLLAKTRRYTAIVAAGLVVDGGIYRHEFVADTVIKALMDVQLRTEVPVFSAVLTPQQFHESAAHFDFFRKHFAIKGIEVAEACANTLHSLERLRGQVAAGIVSLTKANATKQSSLVSTGGLLSCRPSSARRPLARDGSSSLSSLLSGDDVALPSTSPPSSSSRSGAPAPPNRSRGESVAAGP